MRNSVGELEGRAVSNMKQIAEKAGVSLGTVSNVLNSSAVVRESTRRKVMDAVEAAGYRPSQLARGLRRDKTNMIGMVIPDITNPFFPAVVRGAQDVAFAHGYQLILCNSDNDPNTEISHLDALRAYLPAGLIVIPSSLSELTAKAEAYVKSGMAVVCVDRLPRDWKGDTITSNNRKGAYEATIHLLDQGHRRLAMIGGPRQFSNVHDRLLGFLRATRERKVVVSAASIQESTFDQQSGYAKAMFLLRLIPRPTAILAGSDMIAFGALRAIHESGLRCPEDISLVGFDNLDLAETMSPPLSSVSQPGYQMGSMAASFLIDRVRGNSEPPRHVVLKTSLEVRGSVAPPPARTPAKRAVGRKRR